MTKGYTKIENDIFNVLAQLDLAGSDFRVLLFLIRNSIFYQRNHTMECSASFIAKGTGISERQVKRSLSLLLNKKYISVYVSDSSKRGNSYRINGDKLGYLKGHIWSINSDKVGTDSIPNLALKEIKEESKDKEKKEKERAPLSFSSDEEWRAWMAAQEDEDGNI